MASLCPLLDLPSEVLSILLMHLSVDAFVQLTQTCKRLFDIGRRSRDAILLHLDGLPGVKLGLNSRSISTRELFATLHRRASLNYTGAAYHADCQVVRFGNGTLDARASCLTDDADYFSLSLVLKESGLIRHYGSLCQSIAESTPWPYADGSGKIIQIVHRKSTVSVLYAWTREETKGGKLLCGSPTFRPVQPRISVVSADQEAEQPSPKLVSDDSNASRVEYHLVHYNAYNNSRPEFWIISQPKVDCNPDSSSGRHRVCDVPVPIHLAVHSRLKCAIVWGGASLDGKIGSRAGAIVAMYAADRAPVDDVGHYTPRTLLPMSKHQYGGVPATRDREECDSDAMNQDYLSRFKPRASAFTQDGKRLKLYAAGMLCPYAGLIVRTNLSDRTGQFELATPKSFNLTKINGVPLRTENPFHGTHARSDHSEFDMDGCLLSYLQLAVETQEKSLPSSTAFGVPRRDGLFIIQSHDRLAAIDCDHTVSNDLYVLNETDENQRVVAQLRGWSKYWSSTNLTALDMVATSKRGTRIALAMWDHVLVYVLDPAIFSEDWSVQVEGDDASQVSGQHSSSSHTPSDANSETPGDGYATPAIVELVEPKEMYKIDDNAIIKATRYYDLVQHPDFGEIVELWPVVLKLPQGAIARKMIWRAPRIDAPEHGLPDWTSTADEDEQFDSDVTDMPGQGEPEPILNPDIGINRYYSDDNYDDLDFPPKIVEPEKRDGQKPLLPDVQYSPSEAILMAKAAAYQSIEAQRQTMWNTNNEVDVAATSHVEAFRTRTNFTTDSGKLGSDNTQPSQQVDVDGDVDMGLDSNVTDSIPDHTTVDMFTASSEHPNPSASSRGTSPSNMKFDPDLPKQPPNSIAPTTDDEDQQDEPKGKGKEKRKSPASNSRSHSRSRSRSPSPSHHHRPRRRRHQGHRSTPRKKRTTEDELIILTDRGVQIWDLGPMARGRRGLRILSERDGVFGR